MDEVEYKIRSGDSVLVAEAVDILATRILDSHADVLTRGNTNTLFDQLKEKCLSEDRLVSLTACYAFQKLINCGFLTKSEAMSTVMAMLPNVKNFSCTIPIISEILISTVLQMSEKEDILSAYDKWSLIPPQHPFLIVLQHHPEALRDIFSETRAICHDNARIAKSGLKLMRPVFIWSICYPDKSDAQSGREMIELLLQMDHDPLQPVILLECLLLQKTSSKLYCSFSSKIIYEVANWALNNDKKDIILASSLLLADCCHSLVMNGHDPRPFFVILNKLMRHPHSSSAAEVVLGILSGVLLICPITYIADLLALCKIVISICDGSISTLMFATASLSWMYHPMLIAEEILTDMKKIFNEIFSKPTKSYKNVIQLSEHAIIKSLKYSNVKIYAMMELLYTHTKIVEGNSAVWVKQLESLKNQTVQREITLFLQALLLQKTDKLDKAKIFDVLLATSKSDKKLAIGLLPVAIYATKLTKEPSEIISFVKGAPKLAFVKENVHSVVRFCEELVNGKILPLSLLIDVHMILVDNQLRCYPYLQALLDDGKLGSHTDSKTDYLIAKANAVKHICETRPANYGAELVPIISSILNRCTDSDTSAAFCLALGALKALWLAHIVSPPSTWKVLSSKLKKDQRPSVQIAICDLLSVVPQLKIEESEYDAFIGDIIATFWHFAVDFHSPEVANKAFITLSSFNIQDINFKQMPSTFRTNIKLPSEFCKTPADAARKPEDVLDYVPSECWGNCFRYANHETLSGISEMCYQFMCKEIKEYRSGVYQTKQQQEPNSTDYLPPASVVRGVMEFLRKQITNRSYDVFDDILLECVTCLSRKYPKPLPPLNWYFLHDLFHGGNNFRQPCLMLAVRQSVISPSALNFINNYLKTEDINENTMNEVLHILPELCETIAAADLKSIFSKLFEYVFENQFIGKKEEPVYFTTVIKNCLSNEKSREDCVKMISSEIVQYWENIEEYHPGWKCFVEMCCELSNDSLEVLTSPTSWWETTNVLLTKSCYVRSKLALSDDSSQSIFWMNEIIDAGLQLNESHITILNSLLSISTGKNFDKNQTTKSWLLQLMAKTHVHMTEPTSNETSVTFLCDLVIIAIILIVQNYVFISKDVGFIVTSKSARLSLFPQAVAMLLSDQSGFWTDAEGQILEWLHHSKSSKMLSKEYSDAFHLGILSSRNCAYFEDVRVRNKFYNSIYHLSL